MKLPNKHALLWIANIFIPMLSGLFTAITVWAIKVAASGGDCKTTCHIEQPGVCVSNTTLATETTECRGKDISTAASAVGSGSAIAFGILTLVMAYQLYQHRNPKFTELKPSPQTELDAEGEDNAIALNSLS